MLLACTYSVQFFLLQQVVMTAIETFVHKSLQHQQRLRVQTFTTAKEVIFELCFFVCQLVTQKLLNQFLQNSVERRHTRQGRND